VASIYRCGILEMIRHFSVVISVALFETMATVITSCRGNSRSEMMVGWPTLILLRPCHIPEIIASTDKAGIPIFFIVS